MLNLKKEWYIVMNNNIIISKLGDEYIMVESVKDIGDKLIISKTVINVDTMSCVKGDRAVELSQRDDWVVIGRV